ncbi:MAG: LysM peptidoglycan-binding domain-containing protein [Desulfovermiculus sp.]
MSKNKWLDDLDDLEAPPEKEPRSFSLAEWFSNLGQKPHLPWIAAGVAGVLLVFVLTFFLGGDDNETSKASSSRPDASEIESLRDTVNNLETQVTQLTAQMKDLTADQPEEEQNASTESLGLQLQNLENEFNRFRKQATSNFSSLESRLSSQPSQAGSESGSSSAQDSGSRYTVKKGDTLYSIGRKFEASVEDLQSWNNLDSSTDIKPGQKLRVKARE